MNSALAWFLAGTGGSEHQHRGSKEADQAGHHGLRFVPQAQEGEEEEAGEGGSQAGNPQLETSDASSIGSSASTLSDLVNDAPWTRRRTPSPDDLPELMTVEEAAELERQRRQWELTSPHNPPFRGRTYPERRLHYYAVNHRENFEDRKLSRSSTPELTWSGGLTRCETCGLNRAEDWLGGTECASCFSEH